ncbi:MAG: alpha-glucosidase/alpha-galactosidase [Victivallales bacterium]|nr:alpha-glucosidase/alpha-galactosidase [Victivallales bacterium]
MPRITFMGAGSTVFVRNIIGDCMLRDALKDAEVALYDIDGQRLHESICILENINEHTNAGRMKIKGYLGKRQRRSALKGADFVVNAVQVGGYEPSTVIDFDVPKKYGLRQTIGDTLGIGGIFRALRTIPVLLDFAKDMESVCPNAWFLNYSNPMAMLTGAMLRGSSIRTVGLCHSVQVCIASLLDTLGDYSFAEDYDKLHKLPEDYGWSAKIAGINHLAWMLEVRKDGKDMYPELKRKAKAYLRANRGKLDVPTSHHYNLVRLQTMLDFGYYVTESSEHLAEYTPYWIKSTHPELIGEYGIPLDEYPRRCIRNRDNWSKQYAELKNRKLTHDIISREYGSGIMNAIASNMPYYFAGNVQNCGLIENLPLDAIVEVPCVADASGVHGTRVGRLPVQCAALDMTNINVQLLTIEAALTQRKEHIYQAAMLDPHTASELTVDEIKALCDDLIKAHGSYLPKYH